MWTNTTTPKLCVPLSDFASLFTRLNDRLRQTCVIDWESTTTRPLWACAHLPVFLQSSPFTARLFREAVAKLAEGAPAPPSSSSVASAPPLGALAAEWLRWEALGAPLRLAHRCVEWDGWEEGLVASILGAEEHEDAWARDALADAARAAAAAAAAVAVADGSAGATVMATAAATATASRGGGFESEGEGSDGEGPGSITGTGRRARTGRARAGARTTCCGRTGRSGGGGCRCGGSRLRRRRRRSGRRRSLRRGIFVGGVGASWGAGWRRC